MLWIALTALFGLSSVVSVYCLLKYREKIKYYKVAIGNMSAMLVIQRMFELMSAAIPSKQKLSEVNKIILEAFGSKYSTLAIFDGEKYEIRASNVDLVFQERILELADDKIFKNNIEKNVPKYLVGADGKMLTYKTAMERSVRSAMFLPIYYAGKLRGFWLLEDEVTGAFDNMSNEELVRIKDNIGVFIENMSMQDAIELAENKDKQTGFYNSLYLYSTLRQEIATVSDSTIALISLSNLADINNNYSREIADKLLLKAATYLKEIVGQKDILVRYSGTKFCVVSPGSKIDNIQPVFERYLSNVKACIEKVNEKEIALDVVIIMSQFKTQSNIEKEINKMVDYATNSKNKNTIKII